MVLKSASQKVYDLTFKKALEITNNVYDVLPAIDEPAPYPFINMGDMTSVGEEIKDSMFQFIDLDVHIWGTREQRKLVDDLTIQLLNKLKPYGLVIKKSSWKIIADNSTNELLWHSVINLYFEYRGNLWD